MVYKLDIILLDRFLSSVICSDGWLRDISPLLVLNAMF